MYEIGGDVGLGDSTPPVTVDELTKSRAYRILARLDHALGHELVELPGQVVVDPRDELAHARSIARSNARRNALSGRG